MQPHHWGAKINRDPRKRKSRGARPQPFFGRLLSEVSKQASRLWSHRPTIPSLEEVRPLRRRTCPHTGTTPRRPTPGQPHHHQRPLLANCFIATRGLSFGEIMAYLRQKEGIVDIFFAKCLDKIQGVCYTPFVR